MKNLYKNTLIIFIVFLAIYQLLGVLGIIKAYDNPTIANEPTLKLNAKMLVSNLITPEIKDFACYKHEDKILGKHIRVHRICGIENDIIEIKEGVVFRNGSNLDKDLNLVHFYKLSNSEYEKIKFDEEIPTHLILSKIDENTVKIQLKDNYATSKGYTSKKMIDSIGKNNKETFSVFNQNWNKDNFGPLTIPEGKIFVIGDNRDFSIDSRSVGCINKSDIIGIVIQ